MAAGIWGSWELGYNKKNLIIHFSGTASEEIEPFIGRMANGTATSQICVPLGTTVASLCDIGSHIIDLHHYLVYGP